MVIDYSKDYYKILIAPYNATQKEIDIAYKSQSKTFHPDNITGSENLKKVYEERFKEIQEAYDILSNEQTRRRYDLFRNKQNYRNNNLKYSDNTQQTIGFWEKQADACDDLYKNIDKKVKIQPIYRKTESGCGNGCLFIIVIIVIGFSIGFFFL